MLHWALHFEAIRQAPKTYRLGDLLQLSAVHTRVHPRERPCNQRSQGQLSYRGGQTGDHTMTFRPGVAEGLWLRPPQTVLEAGVAGVGVHVGWTTGATVSRGEARKNCLCGKAYDPAGHHVQVCWMHCRTAWQRGGARLG
eukprot:3940842-Rhodomonas_salina.4